LSFITPTPSDFLPPELSFYPLNKNNLAKGGKEDAGEGSSIINPKTRNSLGDKVKQTLTEVEMSGIRKRSELDNQKTCQRTDTVLGLVCEKMGERLVVTGLEEEDRRTKH
jgi:hypothetical protein